jgi:hypothetical protein
MSRSGRYGKNGESRCQSTSVKSSKGQVATTAGKSSEWTTPDEESWTVGTMMVLEGPRGHKGAESESVEGC